MVAFLSAMHFKKTCILKGKKLRCTQRPCISSFWDSGGGLLKNVHIHGQSKNRQNSAHVVLNAPQGVIQDFSINKPAWGIARFFAFFQKIGKLKNYCRLSYVPLRRFNNVHKKLHVLYHLIQWGPSMFTQKTVEWCSQKNTPE